MKLLFICTHNRCRSILAEAITNRLSGGRLEAKSAGSSPQKEIHPLTIKYLRERDISAEGLHSQSWNEFKHFAPDAVLTLCDDADTEVCPVWFGDTIQINWSLPDPSKIVANSELRAAAFNRTIDTISLRINRLLAENVYQLAGDSLKQQLKRIAREIA